METQIHHKLPRCLGGSNDPSNLIELSLYDHAEIHALEFINGGIHFDMRNPFWPVLQAENPELANAVRLERSKRSKEVGERNRDSGFLTRLHDKCRQEGKAIFGLTSEQLSEQGKKGGRLGGKTQGLKNAESGHFDKIKTRETCAKGGHVTNSLRFMCTVTGHVSTPNGLSNYQRRRGIDKSNRIQII